LTSSTTDPVAGDSGSGWLLAGRVGLPHGLDGSFRVSGAVPSLLVLGRTVRLGEHDELRKIERRAGHDGRVLLRLEGCSDRPGAQALRGTGLYVPRSEAPPLEEDEWWAEELEGCQVRDGELEVGVVAELLALPSCEVLSVQRSDGSGDLLVPLISDAVRSVDVKARVIDVDLAFLGEV
jgi:16S rRNA processing protein RimM